MTGKWGCGEFGGTATHKLVQQAIAATASEVDLDLSVSKKYERCDDLVNALRESPPSIPEVIRLLQCCKDQRKFTDDAIQFLQKSRSAVSRKADDCVDEFGIV